MANVFESAARAARTRFEHVNGLGQRLAEQIATWQATEPIKVVYTIAEDRLSWDLRWRLTTPLPNSLGLTLGDAAHNLRSAMDNLLHFIAEQEGATSKELGKVQFPVVLDPERWSDSASRISMLPGSVQEAIQSVQPSTRPEAERQFDGLAILSSLNNADKHRIALEATMAPQEMEHEFFVEFEDGVSSDEPPRTTFHGGYIVDGGLILEHHTSPDRIKTVHGEGKVKAHVVVVDQWGNTNGVTTLLAALLTYVPTVLDVVLAAWQRARARE